MKTPTLDIRNERLLLWAVFGAYVLLLLMALANHELWGDEIHSWNIARSSHGLIDLLRNSRYEGHPPLWYVVLFSITRITHEIIEEHDGCIAVTAGEGTGTTFHIRLPAAAAEQAP